VLSKKDLIDGVTHSFAHSLIRSTGNAENPLCLALPSGLGEETGRNKAC
jgi:hypothetical protein